MLSASGIFWDFLNVIHQAIFQIRQDFDSERFDLKKFDDVEVKEKYQVEI
jgi:hypothetical protein